MPRVFSRSSKEINFLMSSEKHTVYFLFTLIFFYERRIIILEQHLKFVTFLFLKPSKMFESVHKTHFLLFAFKTKL